MGKQELKRDPIFVQHALTPGQIYGAVKFSGRQHDQMSAGTHPVLFGHAVHQQIRSEADHHLETAEDP
jgi:hypothetical protein